MRIPQITVYIWTVTITVALSAGALLSWTNDAGAADDPVCHYREGSADWEVLRVGPISAEKHRFVHSNDGAPGGGVPAVASLPDADMVFDDDCNAVESPSSCVDYSSLPFGYHTACADAVAICSDGSINPDADFFTTCADAGGTVSGTCEPGVFVATYTCSCTC
jgi:hypothetical protein